VLKRQVISIVLATVATCMALTPAVALGAPEWLIAGNPLSSKPAEGSESAKSELVTGAAETTGEIETTLSGGAKVVALCSTATVTNAFILSGGKASAEKTEISGCGGVTEEPSGCKFHEPTVIGPVIGELFDEGTAEVWARSTSQAGVYTTVTLSGCAAEGSYKFTGTACGKEIEPGVQAVTKLGEAINKDKFPLEECSIKAGVNAVEFSGVGEAKLSGPSAGEAWTADF
jgi:hypothetical protein